MNIYTLYVRGDVDISQSATIALAIDEAAQADVVIVDVTQAGYCDTTLINALARLRKRLLHRERFATMLVAGTGDMLFRVLRMLGMIEVLNVTQEPPPRIVDGGFVHHTVRALGTAAMEAAAS